MSFQGKRIWIVGASEGLGREIAVLIAQSGGEVIVSARNASRLDDLVVDIHAKGGKGVAVAADVTDLPSIEAAVAKIGRVDHVVVNAGAYNPMPTADWNTADVISMNDVNYLGAVRVIGAVLPQMIERNAGDITLVGSLAGYRGLPNAIGYGASKAALISMAETMRRDLRDTGIAVRVVNPGFIKTRLTDKNSFKMPMLMTPVAAAERVVRAMGKRKFRTDFPAPFSWVIRLYDYLPDWLVARK